VQDAIKAAVADFKVKQEKIKAAAAAESEGKLNAA
jgi:hypothetical protein